jgi:hypothetical protein
MKPSTHTFIKDIKAIGVNTGFNDDNAVADV